MRFGLGEAHAKADAILLNYLCEPGRHGEPPALTYVAQTGRFGISEQRFWTRLDSVKNTLLRIEQHGRAKSAGAVIDRGVKTSPEMDAALAKLADLPIDIQVRPEIHRAQRTR